MTQSRRKALASACLCLALALVPALQPIHAQENGAEEESPETLKERVRLLEEENRLLREKARAADDLHRILRLQEDAHGQADERHRTAKDLLARDLQRERRLRLQREAELRMLKGNLLYPGVGYAREGHRTRALLWGGSFLLSLGGFLYSYQRQQALQRSLALHAMDPLGQSSAQRRYDAAYRQTAGFGALSAAIYVAGVFDVLYADRDKPTAFGPEVRLSMSLAF